MRFPQSGILPSIVSRWDWGGKSMREAHNRFLLLITSLLDLQGTAAVFVNNLSNRNVLFRSIYQLWPLVIHCSSSTLVGALLKISGWKATGYWLESGTRQLQAVFLGQLKL